MKKFPHEKFLEDNNIDYKTLPEMLYKRIKGFEELKEDLEHTTDEDRVKLIENLETLSHELDEDLEEHFEDHLENNDQEEDEQPEVIPAVVDEHILGEAEVEPISEVAEEPASDTKEEDVQPETIIEESPSEPQMAEEMQEPEPTPEPIIEPEPLKEPTDEEILAELLSDKTHQVSPLELKKMGFKGDLDKRTVLVGKFCLHRGKYDTCYKIILKSQ